jgi:hypothetical protein
MFHAVAMPVGTFHLAQTDVVTQSHASHGCDESPKQTPPSKQCKLNGHLCCLGITAATANQVSQDSSPPQLFSPFSETLTLQIYPDKRFKPPPKSLQS